MGWIYPSQVSVIRAMLRAADYPMRVDNKESAREKQWGMCQRYPYWCGCFGDKWKKMTLIRSDIDSDLFRTIIEHLPMRYPEDPQWDQWRKQCRSR